MKIAVSGKGGVGKTTLAALLANSFAASGRRVIAIDADPDANLAYALGFPLDQVITPLIEMKELIEERVGAGPGKPTVYFRMNPKVDDIPEKFSVKKGNIKLMAMGTIRRGGSGCACPENIMVKELIGHLLIQNDEIVILDFEAGIEHLGRGTSQFVDILFVIVEPRTSSIQTFHRINKLAGELGVKRIAAIANRVRSPEDLERIRSGIGNEIWGVFPESQSLADYHGTPVNQPISLELEKIAHRLNNEFKNTETGK